MVAPSSEKLEKLNKRLEEATAKEENAKKRKAQIESKIRTQIGYEKRKARSERTHRLVQVGLLAEQYFGGNQLEGLDDYLRELVKLPGFRRRDENGG